MAAITLHTEFAPPVAMTIADGSAGTNIEKGTLVKLSDPFTVAASDGDADVIAGVTAEEKIGGDGKTKIGVYRSGIFRATAGGTCTVGKALMSYSSTGDANDLIDGSNACLYSKSVGIALETAADGETFLFELCPGKATVNLLA